MTRGAMWRAAASDRILVNSRFTASIFRQGAALYPTAIKEATKARSRLTDFLSPSPALLRVGSVPLHHRRPRRALPEHQLCRVRPADAAAVWRVRRLRPVRGAFPVTPCHPTPQRAHPRPSTRDACRSPRSVIVSINRFERKKNVALAVEAFVHLQRHRSKAAKPLATGPLQLILAGEALVPAPSLLTLRPRPSPC